MYSTEGTTLIAVFDSSFDFISFRVVAHFSVRWGHEYVCLFRPLFSGLFRLVSPGVETAQSHIHIHIHIHSYPIGPFVDAVASTNPTSLWCLLVCQGKKVHVTSSAGN